MLGREGENGGQRLGDFGQWNNTEASQFVPEPSGEIFTLGAAFAVAGDGLAGFVLGRGRSGWHSTP